MGQKISDGKAFNAAAPAGQVINDYDLFRIAGWNGCAIGAKDASQVDRTLAFEMDCNAIYSIKVPAGVSPVAGGSGFWATQDATTFQRGDTNLALTGAAGQLPCVKFLTTKNAAGYAQCRVLNVA